MKRTLLKVGAPIVAIAHPDDRPAHRRGEAVRAAVVFGAPLGHPAPNGSTRLAWQLLTFLDDRGVKETIPMKGIEVVARSKGHEARWKGSSNADGIAEVSLEMEGLAFGDPLDLEVRLEAEAREAARGGARDVGAPREERATSATNAATVRPTVRNGIVGLDVVIEGGRLIAGFPTPVWVRTTPPAGMAPNSLVLEAEPEPGLLAAREKATPCDSGWTEFPMTAQAHVAGTAFVARRTGTGTGRTPMRERTRGRSRTQGARMPARARTQRSADAGAGAPKHPVGRWFGAMPVAAGAFFISMPRTIEERKPSTVVLIAPNPRDVVYAELVDTRGRVAAAALPVATEAGDPTPRARFELPPLAAWALLARRVGRAARRRAPGRRHHFEAFLVGDGPPASRPARPSTCMMHASWAPGSRSVRPRGSRDGWRSTACPHGAPRIAFVTRSGSSSACCRCSRPESWRRCSSSRRHARHESRSSSPSSTRTTRPRRR